MKNSNKLIILSISIMILITMTIGVLGILHLGIIKIESISISDIINEDNTKTIQIEIHNLFEKEVSCAITDKEELIENEIFWVKAHNNKCSFNVNAGNYYIYIKDSDNNIEKIKTDQININKILDLTINKEKIYLTLGETYQLKGEITSIGDVDKTLTYISSNENIAVVNEGLVTPVSNGTCNIKVKTTNDIEKNVEVIVTDLYKLASQENNKTKLPCGRYSLEENNMIDDILSFKVNEAGYKTRGSVVATARFLVLEFPYRIDYFFENGRLNNYDGKSYVAGEGRYYKKGLYLHEERFNYLEATKYGPAIWGCPLMNWQEESGYVPGRKYPNGLDCSGFVSWALYNAGFDVGDSGAGDTYRTDDIGDLGIKHELTRDFVLNGSYKVGDLIGRDGHIAIIAGLDDEKIYIAESLVGGVVIKGFSKTGSELYKLYGFINTMDEIYQNEGIYTNMW